MKDLILLKLGGSVLTLKERDAPQINEANLRRIGREIAESYRAGNFNLVIIHGAGSYGHPIVKRTGIHEGITREDQIFSFAETQLLQNELNCEVCRLLQEFELPAIPIQPSASAVMKAKRLISLQFDLIKSMVSLSLIPVLFGVPAFDTVQKCSILSGDQIVVYLAKHLHPHTIVFASNVDGIFGKDQELVETISTANYAEVQDYFYNASYADVTGSMGGKIAELKALKGIKSHLINGNTPELIKNILKGKKVRGTTIEF
jgi:isopentenyl phosphate kinase